MPTGSITNEQVEFVETWENVSEVTNYVIRIGPRGDEVFEPIAIKDREFKITTEERILTEDKIVDEKANPFRNGCFRPVIVPDDVSIETNPNALAQEDILNIFQSSDRAWSEWMKTITAPETIRRMIDLAEATEKITLKRFNELQQRLAEMGPRGKRQKALDEYDKVTPGAAMQTAAQRRRIQSEQRRAQQRANRREG